MTKRRSKATFGAAELARAREAAESLAALPVFERSDRRLQFEMIHALLMKLHAGAGGEPVSLDRGETLVLLALVIEATRFGIAVADSEPRGARRRR